MISRSERYNYGGNRSRNRVALLSAEMEFSIVGLGLSKLALQSLIFLRERSVYYAS